MTTDEIKRIYNAVALNYMPNNFVIININGSYKRGLGEQGIYNATKGEIQLKCMNLGRKLLKSLLILFY